jgi:hypothetical protein
MQWTKQQKIVGAVLVLAVAAFVVDRWVIGHEDDDGALVSAQGTAAPHRAPGPSRRTIQRQAKPAAAAVAAAPEASLGDVAALAERLRCAAEAREIDLEKTVRDAFRPPQAWVTAGATDEQLAAAALQARKLTAVARRPSGRGVAIVQDKTVTVGQSLDGFTLIAVTEKSAMFRRGSLLVELKLTEEGQAGGAGAPDKIAGADPSR